jgi:hypothetical protein
MKTESGFQFVDALMIVITAAILISLPVLVARAQNAQARGATCAANLETMSQALMTYMNSNNDQMPFIDSAAVYDPDNVPLPTAATQTDESFASGAWSMMLGENVAQNAWLMIKDGIATEANFRCPGDAAAKLRTDVVDEPATYGWVSPFNYSYGLHVPYATGNNAAPLTLSTPYMLVIIADQLPYSDEGYHTVNAAADPVQLPSNHPETGTTVLTFMGSVRTVPPANSTCGIDDNEIYADDLGQPGGVPMSEDDTSISKSGRFEAQHVLGTEAGADQDDD